MSPETNLLHDLLRRARSRRQLLLSLRGAAISVGVIAIVLLLTGWAAHRYRYNGAALITLRVGALLICLTTIYFALVRPLLKRITDARLARLIEERTFGTEDRLVTAVEFANGNAKNISPAIVNRLYRDANDVSATLDVRHVIRRSRLMMYGGAALASLLLFAGVIKWGPREISEGVAQLVTPTTLAASTNALSIKVKPGTARVPKGSDQDILATLVNFDSQTVTVFARPLGSSEDFQGQTMEPAKARSDFRFSIFNIQDSMEYFVESNSVRSEVYKLNVVDLPYVKQLDLTLNFPAFTNLPTKTIEDGGDIAALKGTTATITAKLSGKVRAARIVYPDGKKVEMKQQDGHPSNFVGELTVTADTSYYIELVSTDGEAYRGSNEYDVSVLVDQPPTISFDKPGRDKKATNLEEVFTQARAEDDYGVVSMDLHFSVNGGEEKKVNLQQLTRDSARSLSGAYTFFLEEYGLKPGDFISYYAKARDASNESTSDIYFIEVKPFEMEYKQAQQQGGGGGGGGADQDQNALSRRQKDLIAATHKLIREGEKYTEQERKDGYDAVAEGQEKLRTDTLEFLDRMGRRLGGTDGQKQTAEMAEHLKQAAKEMENAPPPLRKQAGKDALPPEQRALQRLLAADAIFREVQVASGNQSGQGSGGQREQQELAGLFELELDKMKNQYETVQRAQQQQAEQQKSEAERRLQELAQRQQAALEEQRRRQQQMQGGGSGGSQRQQQEMIDETRKAARELERLSRERRDSQMQQLAQQLNQTADELQKAQSSSRNNPNESIAQNERALERLQQAQQRLQQMSGANGGQQRAGQSGSSGRQQQISDLRQRAAQAASRQREIAKDMENLARRGGQNGQDESSRKAREQLAERKDTLADTVSNLQQDLEQSARAMGQGSQGQQRTARQLKDAADSLARDRVAERIRESKQSLNGGQGQGQQGQQSQNGQGQNGQQSQSGQQGQQGQNGQQGRADERAIERSLNNLSERLQAAEQSARGSNASSAEENLDRTRQLADNLDSLRRRLDQRGQQKGSQQGNQQGQQQGQQGQNQQGQQGQSQQSQSQQGQQQSQGQRGQQGQQGQEGQQGQQGQGQSGQQPGQQQGQQQGSQQAGGTQNGGNGQNNRQYPGPQWGPMGGDWGDNRQFSAEVRERLREAQDLRREWGTTGLGAGRLDEVIEELKRLADGRMEGDAATAAYVKESVIEPLRQLELELSRHLQQLSGRTNLRLRDEGAAPEKYRRAVEEYYRRLSGARSRQESRQ